MKILVGVFAAFFSLAHGDTAASFQERAAAYLEGLPEDVSGEYGAVARLAVGRPISLETLRHALEVVDRRNDCADFRVAGLVRLVYLFGDAPGDKRGRQECPPHTVRLSGDAPGMPPDVYARVRETLLGFKYWMDAPDEAIARRAALALDQLALNMALNSYRVIVFSFIATRWCKVLNSLLFEGKCVLRSFFVICLTYARLFAILYHRRFSDGIHPRPFAVAIRWRSSVGRAADL